ncbi:hypothetical protein QM600_22655 [Rhodococcus sp. IEGM 1379]|nr:hypothetical protein [Rhodococcus sp. IEGM 1379]
MTLATLVLALFTTAITAIRRGEPAQNVDQVLLRAACWRAAHDGLGGRALDLEGVRLVPARHAVSRLLDHTAPTRADFGELDQVTASLEMMLDHGNGAIVQRRTLARRSNVADVIDECARHTFEGCNPQTDTAPAV